MVDASHRIALHEQHSLGAEREVSADVRAVTDTGEIIAARRP